MADETQKDEKPEFEVTEIAEDELESASGGVAARADLAVDGCEGCDGCGTCMN
jgi:hypothetical protein